MKKYNKMAADSRLLVLPAVALVLAMLFTACTQHTKQPGSSSSSGASSSSSISDVSKASGASSATSNASSSARSSGSSSLSSASSQTSSASESVASGYVLYSNARFGYSVPVPSSLKAVSSTSSSGQSFVSSDDAVICSVSGSNNVQNLSPATYFEQFFYGRQAGILSKQESGNTTVVTWQTDGKYGYIKSVVGAGSVDTVRFQFPEGQRAQYDAVAQYMLAHFETSGVDTAH
ncbi:MAG: hypothetical protein ABF449_03790 [Ethanoligenens sp.]|uniref:hypothetical protein n=1 Tax=Ethanoligenens sp. TaxID=2099655 RepID=UPI0039EA9105